MRLFHKLLKKHCHIWNQKGKLDKRCTNCTIFNDRKHNLIKQPPGDVHSSDNVLDGSRNISFSVNNCLLFSILSLPWALLGILLLSLHTVSIETKCLSFYIYLFFFNIWGPCFVVDRTVVNLSIFVIVFYLIVLFLGHSRNSN